MRYIVIKSDVFLPDDLAAHEHAHDGGHHQSARPAGRVAEAMEAADVRCYPLRGLCSYYAERGGIMLGFET